MHKLRLVLAFEFALSFLVLPAVVAYYPDFFENATDTRQREADAHDNSTEKSCNCNGASCFCCVDFNFTYIDFGGPGCVHMTYVASEERIKVNVSYGENLLHSGQVKGPNPEPTCMSFLENLAQVCARFSNLHSVENGLKGCLQLEPKLFGQLQAQFDIGCFTMSPDGMKLDPTSNSTLTPVLTGENSDKEATQTEAEELNEEELIAAVNETAEKSLVFFGNWLGLFGQPDVNATVSTDGNA